jgi:hypothetical protein
MTLASLENIVRADTLNADRTGKPFAFADLIKLAETDGKASSVVIRTASSTSSSSFRCWRPSPSHGSASPSKWTIASPRS